MPASHAGRKIAPMAIEQPVGRSTTFDEDGPFMSTPIVAEFDHLSLAPMLLDERLTVAG
jgi:hypothetical protein